MSDQGELGAQWGVPANYSDDDEPTDRNTDPIPKVSAESQPSESGSRSASNDGGSGTGTPASPTTRQQSSGQQSSGQREADRDLDDEPAAVQETAGRLTMPPVGGAEDPAPATGPRTEPAQWEGSLFDSGQGSGDPRYAPVMPTGPSTPPKPGTPSSGNLRLPDWMREETSGGRRDIDVDEAEEDRRSRLVLYSGVGLLLVALVAAAAVYFLKSGNGEGDADGGRPVSRAGLATTRPAQPPRVRLPAEKPLRHFRGQHTAPVGLIPDRLAGVTYPRLGAPWQIPAAKSGLDKLGWSGQQVLVTEQRGGRPAWYGQLLSGTLSAAQQNLYAGRGTEREAAVALGEQYEAQLYAFPHKTRDLASQPLTVDGHQGWLVASYLTYRQPNVKATGEVVAVAVVDTGHRSPAVMFMAVPNTHWNLWPDFNYVFSSLKITS